MKQLQLKNGYIFTKINDFDNILNNSTDATIRNLNQSIMRSTQLLFNNIV